MSRSVLRSLMLGGACLGLLANAPVPAPAAAGRVNPLLTESALPFHAPPFNLIQDTDYRPAFDAGLAEHLREIQAIAGNPAAPTFDNTMVAMERSGRTLDRVSQTFSGVVGANTNDTLDAVQTQVAPLLSQHADAILLNAALFRRVDTLYQNRTSLGLNPEQLQLLTVTRDEFVHAGANLSEPDKVRLREFNTRLATLETAFQQKLIAAGRNGALVVDNAAALDGLGTAGIAAAAQAAQDRHLTGRWVVALQNTTQQPALESLTDRATRQALFEHSINRASQNDANDTRATIAEIAQLRAQKAALLGYPNWAAYVLYDQMAQTPQAAQNFMRQLVPALAQRQHEEAAELQAAARADGQTSDIQPWDWARYAEQVRHARYDLNQDEVRPYFELNRVLNDGVFFAAHQLYGLTFQERHDIPVYQADVKVFEVFEENGHPLGLMYFDYFRRDNKNGGAWMSNFVGQSTLLGTQPVIYNVANFQRPADGQPALISFDDVTTMFHEFGHALHGLFAAQTYPTLSGTNVARDFVEFPSQFNEHWALEPHVFANYARNYQTGAAMPQPLVDKIRRSQTFNQGYDLGELVSAAMLDMSWHSLPATAPRQDADRFEAQALAANGLDTAHVPPRYRSSYFLHIWGNGYSAGYYAYLWTEMLDDDAYAWFEQHGGLTRANGQRFRDLILSRGHTLDYGPMFRAFYGRDPDIGPMLEHRGLAPATATPASAAAPVAAATPGAGPGAG